MFRQIVEIMIDPLAILFCLVLLLTLVRTVRPRGESIGSRVLGVFGMLILLCTFLLFSAPAIVNPLVEKLELSVGVEQQCDSEDWPLVVLGGGVSSRLTSVDQTSLMYPATFVRLSEATALLERQKSSSLLILAGGIMRGGTAEADVMSVFVRQQGFDEERLWLERESGNTAESAQVLSRLFEQNKLPMVIRLLTSALHMPRSKAVFEKQKFRVCAVVVDRQAIPDVPMAALIPQTTALRKFDLLLHEWVGLLSYRLQGRL